MKELSPPGGPVGGGETMTPSTFPICPHCGRPVLPGQDRRVCGHDLRGGIPVDLWGHRACAAGLRDLVILRGAGTLPEPLAGLNPVDLFSPVLALPGGVWGILEEVTP